MEPEEILKTLEKLVEKNVLSTEDVWRIQALFEELYPKAHGLDIFRRGAEVVRKLDLLVNKQNAHFDTINFVIDYVALMRAEYSGFFMAYHYWLKMLPRDAKGVPAKDQVPSEMKEKIKALELLVSRGYFLLNKKNTPRLWIQYSLLFSLIKSQLQFDTENAKAIDDDIKPLVIEIGEELYQIKEINARGLAELSKRNYIKAIKIFDEARTKFPHAAEIPHCRQDFAHTINNRAKARIDLSVIIFNPEKKADLLRDALRGLREALEIYKAVPPVPPINHIEGVRNRLIIAGFKWLQLGDDVMKQKGHAAEVCFKDSHLNDATAYIREANKIKENLALEWILKSIREAQEIIAEQKT